MKKFMVLSLALSALAFMPAVAFGASNWSVDDKSISNGKVAPKGADNALDNNRASAYSRNPTMNNMNSINKMDNMNSSSSMNKMAPASPGESHASGYSSGSSGYFD